MNDKPNWLKILEHYCFVENKTGLTLPFVIGSNVFSNEFEENDISSLLYETRTPPPLREVCDFVAIINHPAPRSL